MPHNLLAHVPNLLAHALKANTIANPVFDGGVLHLQILKVHHRTTRQSGMHDRTCLPASLDSSIFFPFLANALVTIVCSLNSTDYTHWVFQKDHILSLRFHVLRESVVQRMPPAARCAKRRAKTALNLSVSRSFLPVQPAYDLLKNQQRALKMVKMKVSMLGMIPCMHHILHKTSG